MYNRVSFRVIVSYQNEMIRKLFKEKSMNKHYESVLKAISTLQKQGKTISNKNVHAITGGSIALVGECVKAWKDEQKVLQLPTDKIPDEIKLFTHQAETFIISFADNVAQIRTESLQTVVKDLQSESAELVDNIKQVEDEKNQIMQELSIAKAEIIELKKQIAVDLAKAELLNNQKDSEIERLKLDTIELKAEKRELQNLLLKNQK